jgi:hypothetical protein
MDCHCDALNLHAKCVYFLHTQGTELLQAAFCDADSASTAMQAVAPVGVVLLRTELLKLKEEASKQC